MFDVYPPQQNESNTKNSMKKNIVKLNESQLKKIVAESIKKVINEAHANCGLNSHYMDLFRNRIENAIRTNGDIKKEISQFYYDFRKVIMDKNFTLNNLAILAKDIENGTTSSANITPGVSMFPSAPSFGHKEDFYESKLNRIVAESVKRVLKESFIGGDNQFDNVAQKAKSADDVFKLNYWKYIIESGDKNNGKYVLRCYTDNNSLETRNYPEFEKVVNDLNDYYKLHGSKTIAQALPDDGVSRGRLLKITTKI